MDFDDMRREHGGDAERRALSATEYPADPFEGVPSPTPPTPWQLPLLDTSKWAGTLPPPRRWIVKDWLARQTGGALFGEDGVGKSLLGQQLATCVASGRPFLGLEVTRVPAIYITCEDDALSLWERQRAISRMVGLPVDAAPAGLVSLAGHGDTELGFFGEGGVFEPGPMYHAIYRAAKAQGAGLIVLDGIAHTFPGNEIVRRDVRRFLGAVDGLAIATDAAVLLLGHPAKQAGSEYSGNLGWSAHVRQRWFMGRPDDEESANPDARYLKKGKANLSKRGEQIDFVWSDWAFTRLGDLPNDRGAEMVANAQAASDNVLFLTCLRIRNEQGRPVSESKASRTYAPREFAKMVEAKGLSATRLEAAMDRLYRTQAIERGFVCMRDRKKCDGLRECGEVR